MKFVTFEEGGRLRVGVVVEKNVIDVNGVCVSYLSKIKKVTNPEETACRTIPVSMVEFIAAGEPALKAAREMIDYVEGQKFNVPGAVFPLGKVKLKAPIPRPPKIICIGVNYEDYRRQLGYPKPEVPVFFIRAQSTVTGPDEPIVIPKGGKWPGTSSKCLFQEWEFTVVIGKKGKHIPKEKAYEHIFGYTMIVDVTAHDIEMIQPGHVMYQQRCKAFDSFCPMGPWIVTKDEVPDPHNVKMIRRRNGKVECESSTKNLIFKIPEILEFLSDIMTLEPGDIFSTASPPAGPEEGLQPGDVIESIAEGIVNLRNPVVLEK